ncbi:MICOS complex subunit MIC60-1-like, partial [Limulus polyphemus]|uniref:MICOS complex subunit MIC60 n=1 Tax=Limulus polyphemus TaxID=6850 RepID=A0ABM1RVQ7_LIMPO
MLSGGTKLLLTLLGGSAVAAGGAAAYAKYDPKFQVTLEQNLPYAEEVFKFIPDWKTPPYSEQEKSVKEVKEKSLMTKKLERDSVKKEETTSKPVVMKEPAADEKLEEIPVSKAQTQELSAKKRTDDKKAAQEKVLQEAEVTVSLNRALEERIVSRKESLERLARDAIAAQLLAVEAVKQHTQKLYKALDEPSDAEDKSMWVEINATSEARDKALNNASTTAADVKVNIEELKAAVADGQANKLTAQNPSLLPAEEAISRILYQIQTAETEVAKALGESNVVSEYKDIIEKGKEQFKKELEAILPDVKLGEKYTTLC